MASFASDRPLRILSLDGGGIRGIASLYVLQDLMLHIQMEEKLAEVPQPCDWFDLIVGTSTGGIFALMLGRLKMSVNEAIDAYKLLAEEVFGTETKSWLTRVGLFTSEARYSVEKLEEGVRRFAGEAMLADPKDEPRCRVATVAVKQGAFTHLPDLFRTYKTSVPPYNCTVLDAVLATFASTTLFRPVEVQIRHGLPVMYNGCGLGYNNPTNLAVQEAQRIWNPDRRIGCIVSIGTGISQYVGGSKTALGLKLLDILTDCRAVHMSMDRRFGGKRKHMYFRFDPLIDLGRIGLEEWEKCGEVCNLVHQYLQQDQATIRDCVVALTRPVIQDVVALRTVVQMTNQQERRNIPKAIPSFSTTLFGRDDDVNDIVRVLVSAPGVGVAILGTGGLGKTAVATAVLRHHLVEEAFGALRFFIPCDIATVTSDGARVPGLPIANASDHLVSMIATQLGLDVSQGHSDNIVVHFFSRQPTILVLDNFDTLWNRGGPDLDELFKSLVALPKLRLVVTLRGTDTPWGTWHKSQLSTLDMESARKVFIEGSGNTAFRSDNPFLDKLLAAVDRLPLAICLLAKQARTEHNTEHNLQSLWEDWERRRTTMERDARYQDGIAGARLLRLEASIQLSLERPMMTTNPRARTLLSLLSLLPDGASSQDLEALIPPDSIYGELDQPQKVLVQLSLAYTGSSVAEQSLTAGTPCYESSGRINGRLHVLPPIRDYVQNKHAPSNADQERLTKHYLNIAISLPPDPQPSRIWPDIHNLEAVTVHGLGVPSSQELAVRSAHVLCECTKNSGVVLPALAQSLVEFIPNPSNPRLSGTVQVILGIMLMAQFDYNNARARFEAALQLYEDKRDKAACVRNLGVLALRQCKFEEAGSRLEEARAVFEAVAYRQSEADCIYQLGLLAFDRSVYEEARDRFREALLLYATHPLNTHTHAHPYTHTHRGTVLWDSHRLNRARCTQYLGRVALIQSNYTEARERLNEAFALYEDSSDRLGKASCIRDLGLLAFEQSNYLEAGERFKETLDLYDEVGNRQDKAACLEDLGMLELELSKYREAKESLGEALLLYEEFNDEKGKASCTRRLGYLALNQSQAEEAREKIEEALEFFTGGYDKLGKAQCIYDLGLLAFNQSEYEEARTRFNAALSLYEVTGNRRGKAQCIHDLGRLSLRQSQYEEARERLQEALVLYAEVNDRHGRAHCVHNLAQLALNQSENEEAIEMLEEAVALYEEIGHRRCKADCIHSLGEIALNQSNYEKARERFDEALPLYEEAGNRRGKAHCNHNLGRLALIQSKYEEARERLQEALVLYAEVSDRHGRAHCVHNLAQLALNQSENEEAIEMLEEAVALYEEIGHRRCKADSIRSLGEIALNQSNYEKARERFDEALPLYEEAGNRRGKAHCNHNLGRLALIQSKYEEARERLQEALVLYDEVSDRHGRAHCVHNLAQLALNQSENEEAIEMLEEAVALYEEVGDERGEADCIRSLGDVALNQSSYEEAKGRFEEALALYEKVNDRRAKADCIRRLEKVTLNQLQYEEDRERRLEMFHAL